MTRQQIENHAAMIDSALTDCGLPHTKTTYQRVLAGEKRGEHFFGARSFKSEISLDDVWLYLCDTLPDVAEISIYPLWAPAFDDRFANDFARYCIEIRFE